MFAYCIRVRGFVLSCGLRSREDFQLRRQVASLRRRAESLNGAMEAPERPANQGSFGHPSVCRRPCVLFLRGRCEAANCSFCHLPHHRVPNFDKVSRQAISALSDSDFLQLLLPHMERSLKQSDLQSSHEFLENFKREVQIRSFLSPPTKRHRRFQPVLTHTPAAGLIGMLRRRRGPLSRLAEEALARMRAEAVEA